MSRCSYPSRGYPCADALQACGIIQQRRVHIGLNVSRRNSVNCHAARCPLVGKALGQLANSTLGRRVGGHRQAALEGEQRGKVDDGSPATRYRRWLELKHVCAKVAAESKDGAEVDLDHIVEIGVEKLLARVPALDAGAIDKDSDLMAVGQDLGRQLSDIVGGAEVGRVDACFAAKSADGVTGGGCTLVSLSFSRLSHQLESN